MIVRLFCLITFLWIFPGFASSATVTGKLHIHTIDAKVFPYSHGLRVWLPPGYEAPENLGKTYQVLYLLDGQNLFDKATSYSGTEWSADEAVAILIARGKIPPIIIVGLDNAGEKRAEEYLPFDDPLNPGARDAKGKLFPKYLKDDVMPFIRAHYRVAEGPENTGIGGSSYGGIAALNFAINEPLLAARILIESPSLQVGNGVLFRETKHLVQVSSRIYIGMGSKESGKAEIDRVIVSGARALAKNLSAAAIPSAIHLSIGAGDRHHESAWARRLPEALIFLYGTHAGNIHSKPRNPERPAKRD